MRRTFGAVVTAATAAISVVVVMAPASAATTPKISLFAGNGNQATRGPAGNGGKATAAEFYHNSDVAFSASGTAYIADMRDCQVRQVVNGVISAFAGVGTCVNGGNAGVNTLKHMGGQAAAATIGMPTGVAVDSSGNVYIADCVRYTGTGTGCQQGNVLKVSTSGVISIFAGDSLVGNGGTGTATATSIGAPWGVRTDGAGDVFFSDVVYNVIREVNTSGIMSTVAGNGTAGYAGDGGAATTAELNDPTGIYVDNSGNLFIADSKNAVIRKVNSSGIISTFAGDGTAGSAGNGGQAVAAELDKPFGVSEDSSGNVYIADYNAYCVRDVSATGVISTYAGTCGTSGNTVEGRSPSSVLLEGPSQVVFDPSGNLYINDYAGEQIDEVVGASTGIAPSTPTISNLPTSAAVGASFTATVSTNSNGVTSVASNSTSVCTVGANGLTVTDVGAGTCSLTASVAASSTYAAATGTPQTFTVGPVTPSTPTISNLPTSAAVGASFTATVSTNSNGVTSVASNSTSVCTVGANGLTVTDVGAGTCSLTASVAASSTYAAATGTPQTFTVGPVTPSTPTISNLPTSAAVGASFTATVSTNSNGVTSVASNSTSVCTVGANGLTVTDVGAGTCSLTASVAASSTYAAATGTPQTFTVGPVTPSTPTISNLPTSAAVGASFTATVSTNSNGVTSVASNSTSVCTVGANGLTVTDVGAGTCSLTASVAASSTYAAATGTPQTFTVGPVTHTISLFAGNGNQATRGPAGNGGKATAAEFYHNSDVAFSASGTAYIADMKDCQVRQVVNGVISAFAGVGTCVNGGNAGVNTLSGMGGQAAAATIGMPTGVAVDSSGNVYIAVCVDYTGTGPGCQQGNVLKVSTSGVISIFAGDSLVGNGGTGTATATSIGAPWGVRTDGAGDVFFSDVVYNVIREVNTSGIMSTVAGNGTAGYAGDGGAATTAELNDPTGIYVDNSGNLFIADSKNAVIRKVNSSGIISTFAGDGTAGSAGNGGQAVAAELDKPFGVSEDSSGNVYIADYNAYCVRDVSATGVISTYAGTCGTSGNTVEGRSPSSVLLEGPSQVVFDPSGNLYINDYAGEQIDEVVGAQ